MRTPAIIPKMNSIAPMKCQLLAVVLVLLGAILFSACSAESYMTRHAVPVFEKDFACEGKLEAHVVRAESKGEMGAVRFRALIEGCGFKAYYTCYLDECEKVEQ